MKAAIRVGVFPLGNLPTMSLNFTFHVQLRSSRILVERGGLTNVGMDAVLDGCQLWFPILGSQITAIAISPHCGYLRSRVEANLGPDVSVWRNQRSGSNGAAVSAALVAAWEQFVLSHESIANFGRQCHRIAWALAVL